MLKTLLAGAIAAGAWLAWHLLGDMIGEAIEHLLRPVLRPAWGAMGRARTPWPLAVLIAVGAGCAWLGYRLLHHDDWRATAGFVGFVGGATLLLAAPLLWRDARRDAAQDAASTSRPVV